MICDDLNCKLYEKQVKHVETLEPYSIHETESGY